MDLTRRLMEYLDQPGPAQQERMAGSWLARAGSDHPPLVLYGAGNLGRKVRAALAGSRFQVVAFCDNDPGKWDRPLDGLPVMAPVAAAERFGTQACFVVTIWRAEDEPPRFLDTEAALKAMGVSRVAHFTHLAWAHPEGLVPHYSLDLPLRVLAARREVLAALALFADDRSRDMFIRHALWRLTLEFDLLPAADPEEIYFPEGLIRPGSNDVLADAGGFDGDTCRRMLELWGAGARRIHAFEPDPASAWKFMAWREASPARERIQLHRVALGSSPGSVRFQGTGSLNATSVAGGGVEVPRRTLDEVLAEDPPDFIKMDIEGAEREALQGAATLLRRGPSLAICLYHVQDHLWSIPLLVRSLMPEHRLFLRYHGTDAWELALYATP